MIEDCILGLNKARHKNASNPDNFEDWLYATFGSGIGRHFMIPYNQKQWAVDLRKMSCDWISKRVPIPRIEDVLEIFEAAI